MQTSRRGFLLTSGLVLAGCAATPASPGTKQSTETSSAPSSSAPSSSGPSSSAAASSSATATAPAVLTREQIVAQFGGRTASQWGLEVSGVVQRAQSQQIALTLDACGGPKGSQIDQPLIDFLTSTQTPATLFINSRWIEANPALTDQLISNDLFCIGNHGTRHVPLSINGQAAYGIKGTASIAEAYDEVMGNQQRLTTLMGEPPKFFRPGTAYYDEVCAEMVRALGLLPVNFDINSDGGATFSTGQVVSAMSAATPGSICIGHFNQPGGSTAEGLMQAVPALKAKGRTFARLDAMTLA